MKGKLKGKSKETHKGVVRFEVKPRRNAKDANPMGEQRKK